ncbi:MAG TPA: phosphatidylglycerophosphatase A [Stellaceae bacterium]|nr:phosphatidylglycerophosphatase A [Stellaceae bacterium]
MATPLSRAHPAMLVATLAGIGFLPKAPGTWGSLVALPFVWLAAHTGGAGAILAAAAAIFAIGWWAAAIVVQHMGDDPPAVVVDEAAGQFLALAAAPLDLWHYAAGFALFRLFDIAKPWPVGWADRTIPGGFGVMVDDVLAAVYAAAVLFAGGLILGR